MGQDYNYKIYTPEEYAISIAKNALDKYYVEMNEEEIENLKIIDISCGSGNLLLAILEEVLKSSKEIYGEYKYRNKWITGYDIDLKALEICRERSKVIFKKYGLDGELNLKEKDSLYEEFEEKYNIVLGNPPYLGEKNHKDIFQTLKKTEFGKKYYQPKMDYFYFFIEKGIDLLEEKGILIYLTTNYWLKADSAEKLREKFKAEGQFFKIENYDHSIFKNAVGQHNIIFSWEKSFNEKYIEVIENDLIYKIENIDLYGKYHNKILLIPPLWKDKLNKIRENSNCVLGELVNINQGIVSGADKVYVFKEYEEKFKDYLKPFYKNKDIGKYEVSQKPPFWILYLDKKTKLDRPIYEYLKEFEDKLSSRREVVHNRINWWELQWSRDEKIFKIPKIVVRQRCKTNNFAYTEDEFYGSADIYYLTSKNENINLFYLLGYLNSNIFYSWYNYIGKKKGKNLEFYSTPLKETPIFYSDKLEEILYIEDLVKKQLNNYSEERQEKINEFFQIKLEIK